MTNVDAEEIDKFERLASKWWDPHGDFKPLHDINPLRLVFPDTSGAARNVYSDGPRLRRAGKCNSE